MDMDSTKMQSRPNVVFPLTLKDAIEYLASQTSEYTPNNNNLHNKIWQQLSQRLRLIFDKFPENQLPYKKEDIFNYNYNNMKIVEKCLSHELSSTRTNIFGRNFRYIYCAVTMYYIQHKDTPLSSNDVPEKWIQRRNSSELDLRSFVIEVEKMNDTPNIKYSQDGTEAVIIDEVKYPHLVGLIGDIDKLIKTTYKYINQMYISHLEMRKLLSGIDGYSADDKCQTFLKNYYDSDIEKILTDHFAEYFNFCDALNTLIDIYNKASDRIESDNLLVGLMKTPALPAIWDEVSKTETEISQVELDFFSYLLEIIPPRSTENKNLARQLSSGKWYLLPIETRSQIVDYIMQISKQPQRIARFLGIDFSDDEEKSELIDSQIKSLCFQIRYPHHNKAYAEFVDLYCVLNGNKEILTTENLGNILKKVSKICEELQKSVKDTVENEQ